MFQIPLPLISYHFDIYSSRIHHRKRIDDSEYLLYNPSLQTHRATCL